jgi:hypothetical protein
VAHSKVARHKNEGLLLCSVEEEASSVGSYSDETEFFELPSQSSLCCDGVPCAETAMCQEWGLACPTTSNDSSGTAVDCEVRPRLE